MFTKWQFWLGIGISALFLLIALRGLQLEQLWQTVRMAQYLWLVPGVLMYFVAVWVRVWRWHYLLRPIKVIPLKDMWPALVIGYMGNNIYPFRAGEVLRVYVLKRKTGITISANLATVIIERVFDGLVMLIFVMLALPTVPNLPTWLRQVIVMATLAFFGALMVFFALATIPEKARAIYGWLITSFLPAKLQEPILHIADNFMWGLSSLRGWHEALMIFVTSIVIWLLETVKYWFVMHAFSFSVSFLVLMMMNGVVNLATTIPSAPGYIGTFDGPGIEILRIFGVPDAVATGYTLTLHLALWLPITLLGLWYMIRESLNWQEFSQVASSRANLTRSASENTVISDK